MKQIEITAGNWNKWSHFLAFGLSGYEATHFLWEHGNNVNSPLLSEHNAEEITRRLEAAGIDAEATTVGGGLRGTFIYAHLVRVADEQGQPIQAAIDAVQALMTRLDGYPILDEEGYIEKVDAANHRLLADELRYNALKWDYPASEGPEAYHQLAWDVLDTETMRDSDLVRWEDWFPEFDREIGEALEELGYQRVEEDAA